MMTKVKTELLGPLVASLVNLAYALDGRPEPAGETTEQEMVETLRAIAEYIRTEGGLPLTELR